MVSNVEHVEGGEGLVSMYPGRGAAEGCEGGREGAEGPPGTDPCPALPGGGAEPCGFTGLLPGVKEGAFTFSLNSRANGLSFELGAASDCAALLL